MNILGIETSCDETSASVIVDGKVASNIISSQDFHKEYGGVVPELSSRAHLQLITKLIKNACKESKVNLDDIDIISATAGPGLIGALLVGLNIGKGLAYSLNKNFISVNHIEGHIFSGFLMEEKPDYPYLCLVVSGGHTLLLVVKDEMNIVKLGTTIDDAVGEAFDKVSKLLGLGYPGGPAIQNYASRGNPDSIDFPISRLKTKYDFSFSGIKTAVLRHVQSNYDDSGIPEKDLTDIAASFQNSVVSALLQKVDKALAEFEVRSISLVGGVAANLYLRENLQKLADKYSMKVVIPDIEYCGDNAAMIANRAEMLFRNGKTGNLMANAYAALPPDVFKSSLNQT